MLQEDIVRTEPLLFTYESYARPEWRSEGLRDETN
jgi:hypothetical protein